MYPARCGAETRSQAMRATTSKQQWQDFHSAVARPQFAVEFQTRRQSLREMGDTAQGHEPKLQHLTISFHRVRHAPSPNATRRELPRREFGLR